MYVTYDLWQRHAAVIGRCTLKVHRVYIAGDVKNWKVARSETDWHKVYGVKCRLRA